MRGLVQIRSRYPKNFSYMFSKIFLKIRKKYKEFKNIYLRYLTNSVRHTELDKPLAVQSDISPVTNSVERILYKHDCDFFRMYKN